MPGNLSRYAKNKLLDHILGTTAYTMPTEYVALYTTSPTQSSSGVEVTGGSYSRKTATFSAAVNGVTSNSSNITFTGMPACTVVAVSIVDALTGGNILVYGALQINKTVLAGDTLRIPTGSLIISMD